MEQKICPVDVICVCSADGDIRPLRFRMENEAHQLIRVDIDEGELDNRTNEHECHYVISLCVSSDFCNYF